MATPYPRAFQIEEMFANRDVPSISHPYLADPIDVVVVGQDFRVGGQYKSMEAFQQGIYARVADSLKIETIRVEVRRVIGGGKSPWAVVKSLCTAEGKFGKAYHLEFVDLVRFDSQNNFVQIKGFLDSGHLQNQVEHHESKHGKKVEIPGHIPTLKEILKTS